MVKISKTKNMHYAVCDCCLKKKPLDSDYFDMRPAGVGHNPVCIVCTEENKMIKRGSRKKEYDYTCNGIPFLDSNAWCEIVKVNKIIAGVGNA